MILKRITVEDWEGIYDAETGRLITQGHSVDYDTVLEYLGHVVVSKYIEDDDLSEFGNSLPETLEEIEDYIAKK